MRKFRTFSAFTLLFIFSIGTIVTNQHRLVFAACTPEEEQLAIITNKPFYCEDISTVCEDTSAFLEPLTGNDNAEKIWNFFMKQPGFKPYMAAAFLGNMQEEAHFDPRLVEYSFPNSRGEISQAGKPSSFDDNVPPNAKSNGQPGYGIIQWTFPTRKQGLRDKVSNDPAKRKASDLTLQLEYMWSELNGGYKGSTLNPVLASKTVAEATTIITYHFETPRGKEAAAVRRTKYAEGWLAKFGSKAPPSSETTPATPVTPTPDDIGLDGPAESDNNCTSETTTDPGTTTLNGPAAAKMVEKALLFAWPEGGHGLSPKPEYAAAVKQFKTGNGGNYYGGSCDAFISTVMKATGADPSYPVGNVVAQMAYVKNNPTKYEVTKDFNLEDLRPGDILQVGPGGGQKHGHTYMFVGKQPNGRNKADASFSSRMPNLGNAQVSDKRGHYTRVRVK